MVDMYSAKKITGLAAVWAAALLMCSCQAKQSSGGAEAGQRPAALTPLETVRRLTEENRRFEIPAGTDNSAHPAEMRDIRNRGFIIFAMTAADQKPFFYVDEQNGELIGLDVEIAYEIANRLGVRAVFNREAGSFDGVVMKVVQKEADVALSKLSRTSRRAELIRYTRPYIVFRQALLVNRLEFAKIGPEEALPAYITQFSGRLGVIQNSSYVNYAAANFPAAVIETYEDWGKTVDALFSGKVLAVYRDEGEILIVNATRKDASMLMKPVFISDKRDPIAMAVAADAPLLHEWLNVFLDDYVLQNSKELTVKRLVERHFGSGAR
jgi:ABC-type amino acid transport substrate-binding protein